MLNGRVPYPLISGFLMNHSHRITETSTEAFLLRLFREENKTGFIKAFSESPESFTSGFNKVEKTMKFLFLRRMFLWPRFHLSVSEVIGQAPRAEVIEFKVSLTENMKDIQAAIIECMEACLNELKRANPSVRIEVDI